MRKWGDLALPYAEQNVREMDVDDGVAVLRAMQDGGWRRGKVPNVVKHSLKELRKSHKSWRLVAEHVGGLTRAQVEHIVNGGRKARERRNMARAALAIG